MTGDCHVRICGSPGLRCPGPPDRCNGCHAGARDGHSGSNPCISCFSFDAPQPAPGSTLRREKPPALVSLGFGGFVDSPLSLMLEERQTPQPMLKRRSSQLAPMHSLIFVSLSMTSAALFSNSWRAACGSWIIQSITSCNRLFFSSRRRAASEVSFIVATWPWKRSG